MKAKGGPLGGALFVVEEECQMMVTALAPSGLLQKGLGAVKHMQWSAPSAVTLLFLFSPNREEVSSCLPVCGRDTHPKSFA